MCVLYRVLARDTEITLFKSKVGFFSPSASDKVVLDKATGQLVTVAV
ncbi:hypothetical protein [Lunatibacter salilacus]|nr:hypothetical protein [Lunatibacter salilacus]